MRAGMKKAQNKDAEREFFGAFVKGRGYDVFDDNGYSRIMAEFLKFFRPARGLKVMDLGCGTGAFTGRFLKYGFQLSGIDISPGCIEYARKRYPEISFEVGDIEDTRCPDGAFDVVLLSAVLHHFQDLSTAIRECHRILKKGGVLLAYDPNRSNPFMRVFRCKDSPLYISKGVTKNESPLGQKEIAAALKSCGFSEHKVYGISGITFRYIDSKAAFLIQRFIDLWPLRERIGSFLITYAKKTD
jgi:ubiquinone/menaquinone biosynthesis C-methylase UbiE